MGELPQDFRCPISLEVMTDPVILFAGHTFDRASIQRWLDSGNSTCPITNIPLPPAPFLIATLRSLVSSFLAQKPTTDSAASDAQGHHLLSRFSFPSDASSLAAVLRLAQRGGAKISVDECSRF